MLHRVAITSVRGRRIEDAAHGVLGLRGFAVGGGGAERRRTGKASAQYNARRRTAPVESVDERDDRDED